MSFLKGKTAIITGAGYAKLSDGRCGSIGYGIATAYAKEGANLVITGRNVKKLEDAKEELEKAIAEDIDGTKNLVLDIKGVEYISSAGLRVLLAAQKKISKTGLMKVINVCPEVMEIFEITGFTDILNIE